MGKSENKRRLKQLIKKYHPDLHNDAVNEPLFNEITVKLVEKLNDNTVEESVASDGIDHNKPAKGKQQDYEYYKRGIKYYRNIHPNQFYKRNTDTTFETKTNEELSAALDKIKTSFRLADYYFKKIISEYPQSPYANDSKTKILLLKKLYKSYENTAIEENKIINSEQFMKEMGLSKL